MAGNLDVLLRVSGITKTFGLTKALTDVSFELKPGEIRGLIGENGSGKSTVSNCITGALKPDAGSMEFMGQAYAPAGLEDSEKAGIGMLIQESGTINKLTVAENIFLGRENLFASGRFVNKRRMVEEAGKALRQVGADNLDPKANVESYTFEERKMIEVASVLYFDPVLLIIDETTTALSKEGAQKIHEIMRERRDAGKTILFISHDLEELRDVCDSVTILRDGRYIDTLTGDFTIDEMRQLMIGREMSEHYYREDTEPSHQETVVMDVRNLTYGERIQNLSFQLRKGEILGFGGLADSGTHDLPKLLFGAIRPDSGEVILTESGKPVGSTENAIRRKVAYLPKDRDRESLMLTSSIKHNISLASYDKLSKFGLISRRAETKLADENAKKLSIKMQGINQEARALSGGNKQKIVVAKWLANDSEILIMDSPTRGIDIGVKADIYQMMSDLKAEGKAIIIICDEMPELIGMSDRIIILKDGVKAAEFERSPELSEHVLIETMI